MKVIVTKNYDELSKVAANEMASVVKNNPKAILKMSCDGIRNPACCFPKRRLLSCLWLWHRKKDVISRNSAYQTKGAAKSHF